MSSSVLRGRAGGVTARPQRRLLGAPSYMCLHNVSTVRSPRRIGHAKFGLSAGYPDTQYLPLRTTKADSDST